MSNFSSYVSRYNQLLCDVNQSMLDCFDLQEAAKKGSLQDSDKVRWQKILQTFKNVENFQKESIPSKGLDGRLKIPLNQDSLRDSFLEFITVINVTRLKIERKRAPMLQQRQSRGLVELTHRKDLFREMVSKSSPPDLDSLPDLCKAPSEPVHMLETAIFEEALEKCPPLLTPPLFSNSYNSCFLVVIAHLLMNNQKMVEALDILSSEVADPSPALSALLDFVEDYETAQVNKNVLTSEILKLRQVLNCLDPEGFLEGEYGQEDADEALGKIRDLILDSLPIEKKKELFPESETVELVKLEPLCKEMPISLDQLIDTNNRLINAAKGTWEFATEPSQGALKLVLPQAEGSCQLSDLIKNYFFYDPEQLKRSDPVTKMTFDGMAIPFQIEKRRLYFATPPSTLYLTLNRFIYSPLEEGYLRNNVGLSGVGKVMEIPACYFLNEEPVLYELEAAIFHEGTSPYSGHYTMAMSKIGDDGKRYYFFCDDLRTPSYREIDQQEFLADINSKRTYLLMYVKP